MDYDIGEIGVVTEIEFAARLSTRLETASTYKIWNDLLDASRCKSLNEILNLFQNFLINVNLIACDELKTRKNRKQLFPMVSLACSTTFFPCRSEKIDDLADVLIKCIEDDSLRQSAEEIRDALSFLGCFDLLLGNRPNIYAKSKVMLLIGQDINVDNIWVPFESMQQIVQRDVLPFFEKLYGTDVETEKRENIFVTAVSIIEDAYIEFLSSNIFTLINQFPSTTRPIKELRMFIDRSGNAVRARKIRDNVQRLALSEISKTLLNPGTSTNDIISFYLRAVNTLRLLDKSELLLNGVCQPIRDYLRERSDSVRCIVSLLTEQGHLDRLLESQYNTKDNQQRYSPSTSENGSAESSNSILDSETDEKEMENDENADPLNARLAGIDQEDWRLSKNAPRWMTWKPDPREALHMNAPWRRGINVISMLVGIYGSKDMFINEYRQLLATRLLTMYDVNETRETRHWEVLRTKFNVADTDATNIILSDMAKWRDLDEKCATRKMTTPNKEMPITMLPGQSSDVCAPRPCSLCRARYQSAQSANILGKALQRGSMHVRIISDNYWPRSVTEASSSKSDESTLMLPDCIQHTYRHYDEAFRTSSCIHERKLNFKHEVGIVSMNLSIGDGTGLELLCSPVHACIITKFLEQEQWILDDLAKALSQKPSIIRSKLRWWCNLQILTETEQTVYSLTDHLPDQASIDVHLQAHTIFDEQDDDMNESNSAEQVENELDAIEKYWSYLHGICKADAVPMERIHTTLKLFASPPGSDWPSVQAVKTFLQRKVHAGLLTIEAQGYKSISK